MKKIFTMLILLSTMQLSAQIVIDTSDFPKGEKRYNLYQGEDFWGDLSDKLDWGTGTANEVYDFSQLDSFIFDTTAFMLTSPAHFGFQADHPNADYMTITDQDKATFRKPIKLNASDFITGANQFEIYLVNPSIGPLNLNDVLFIHPEFNYGEYNLMATSFFGGDSIMANILNPANTPFSANFPNADAAIAFDTTFD
ncbi:MAG: hypothetical protein KDC92_17245, partial [Bacteroidetes bacterium]|nr:hypothetical protein [Bacteroidota bacterium]